MGKHRQALQQVLSCFFPRQRNRIERTTEENTKIEEEGNPDGIDVSVSRLPEDIIFDVLSRLPVDIIFDVLSRLPVKALCQFRCMSKAWRDLISDPAFVAVQRFHAARPLVVGVFGKPRPLEKFYPPRPPLFPQPSLELRVMDTADGSVLRVVKDVKSTKLMRTRLDLVFVDQGLHGGRMIDPANGRVVSVVHGREYPTAYHNGSPCYALHTQFCHSSFGRATPSGSYKVVRLRDTLDSQVCQVATLEDNVEPTWRQRPEPPIFTCWCSSCTATIGGTLYFMDRGAPAHGTRPGPPGWNRIAAFDLESEEWKTMIDAPPVGYPMEEERWEIVLAELKKGILTMVQTVRSRYPLPLGCRYTNIWHLVDSEKSIWVRECTIEMTKSWRFLKPLEISGDGRILMLNAFKKEEEHLYDARCILQLYDPNTGTLTDLMKMPEEFRGGITLYTGSLLS